MPSNREYHRKGYQFAFETKQEQIDLDNKIENLKHKSGIRRSDVLMRMGLELLEKKYSKEEV